MGEVFGEEFDCLCVTHIGSLNLPDLSHDVRDDDISSR